MQLVLSPLLLPLACRTVAARCGWRDSVASAGNQRRATAGFRIRSPSRPKRAQVEGARSTQCTVFLLTDPACFKGLAPRETAIKVERVAELRAQQAIRAVDSVVLSMPGPGGPGHAPAADQPDAVPAVLPGLPAVTKPLMAGRHRVVRRDDDLGVVQPSPARC